LREILNLLYNPCISIGETAAMVHMTPHAGVMTLNGDEKLKGQAIKVGYDRKE